MEVELIAYKSVHMAASKINKTVVLSLDHLKHLYGLSGTQNAIYATLEYQNNFSLVGFSLLAGKWEDFLFFYYSPWLDLWW